MARKKKSRGSAEKERWLKELGETYSKELIEKATKWELEFKSKLEEAGLVFKFQCPIVCERNHLYILDFYLPRYKLAFEIDGAHHYTKEGQKADRIRTDKLKKAGIFVKRIANYNVKVVTPQLILDYLKVRAL